MPTKPKPSTVKKPAALKPPTALYKAIQAHLEAKDRETLHARTKKATEAVEALLEGVQPAEVSGPLGTLSDALKHAPIPWSFDGLVVNPGAEAIGNWGFFWDNTDAASARFGYFDCIRHGEANKYNAKSWGGYAYFAYIPNFPGAELLKRTTGYEAGK